MSNKSEFPLTKLDKSNDPQNEIKEHSFCVKNCNDYQNYTEIANRCLNISSNENGKQDFDMVLKTRTENFEKNWLSILITCIVAFVLSYVLMMLFRYAIKYVIWAIYFGIVVLVAFASVVMLINYFGVRFLVEKTIPEDQYLVAFFIYALVALILGRVLFHYRTKVHLVVELFKEASRVLNKVPLITVKPLLTFICLGLTYTTFIYLMIVI